MVIKDPRAREFASGLLSAMVSISITFPVTKLIYRQILEKASYKNSLRRMRIEGLKYVYRGMFPPLIQRSLEISVMFGGYKTVELALHPMKLSMYDEKVASSVISGIMESVFTPFERSQLLLVDPSHHTRFRNMTHVFLVLGKEYGLKEFFRGYTSILLRNIFHNAFFFLTKDELSGMIRCHKAIKLSIQNFLVGAFVGLMMTTLFYPLKVVKANMQYKLGGRFKSVLEVSKEVYKHDGKGIKNFYLGLGVNIIRAMLGWGITNLSYEFIRNRI